MTEVKVSAGSKELLDLKGRKKYSIQATVRTVSVFNPGEKNSSLIDCEVLVLHHDFNSVKTPKEVAAEEVRAFLEGFETASVRVEIKERLSNKIKVLTLNRIESVDLFIYTPNGKGWYWEGQLKVPFTSSFFRFCKLAKKSPNVLSAWGNFQNQ